MKNQKLLIFNVHFMPNSFGGATIVAENMARYLQRDHNWDIVVVTTIKDPKIVPYGIVRYQSAGISIIAINAPQSLSYVEFYKHDKMSTIIRNLIQNIEPDVAHVHSIQTMGAGILDELSCAGVPVAVTVHDCWWICERQFMINKDNRYCFQAKIDRNVCQHCVDDFVRADLRLDYLRDALLKADMLLFPSEFHKQLFVQNDFPVHKCHVNKNGILPPRVGYKKTEVKDSSHKVRFGFTGGPGPIKGLDIIVKAFSGIDSADYELVLVDAAQNIQVSWHMGLNVDVKGTLTVRPAYTQETMDGFFSQIDVLLFPSQWKESFGLTVREALIRDVWVISTDVGGPAEDCVDTENSALIPLTSDAAFLTSAIEACMDKDWKSYKNPYKKALQTVASQAEELSDYLTRLANKVEH